MKILYVATVLSHICQFHLPHLQMLKEQGHEIHVAAHDNLAVKNGLQLLYTDRHIEIPFERSPYDPRNIAAYRKLRSLLAKEHYDIIVCNTPVGGILTRLAAQNSRRQGTRVIYIAHGFHFYKGSSKKNWILYYPLEKAMARLCDIVITINNEDYQFAKKHFPGRVEHIHGVGVRENRYRPATEAEQAEMRRAEGLSKDDFVVICTGELNRNKNQATLISAAALLKNKIPNLKVLLAGNGPKEQDLRRQIAAQGLENTVKLLGYRTDLERLIPAVNVVVSCSKREGLPLNIVEAMLCRKPVAASVNRGNSELVDHGVTGYLQQPEDVKAFAKHIYHLYKDKSLAERMGEAGCRKAQSYTAAAVKKELSSILSLVPETKDMSAIQKQLWITEQEILDVIDKVCVENGLRYSLGYGTLLGAVRHGGFIPWDDDIDVMMPREDYERLIKIWPSAAPGGYLLETERMFDDYVNNFLKIRKDHTTYLQFESERKTSHHTGIFVDIFPADRRAPGPISRRLQKICFAVNLLYNRGYAQKGGRTAFVQRLLLSFVPKQYHRRLSNWAGEKSRKWTDNTTCELVFPCTIRDCSRFYPADLFNHLEKIPFNGKEYCAFRERDLFLRTRYGDYMELPPEDERVWKHYPILVDFQRNYEELEAGV